MNDLTRYLATHPHEDPRNFVGTRFDPVGATAYRQRLRAWKERNRSARRMRQPAAFPPAGPAAGSTLSPLGVAMHHWRYSLSRL